MRTLLTFLLLVFLFSNALSSSFSDYEMKLREIFGKVKTLEVKFSQKTKLPVAGDEITLYKGIIYYKRPLKFRWQYTWGDSSFIVSDGKFIESFIEGNRQVYPIKEGELFPLIELVEFPDSFFKEFKLVKVDKEGGVLKLRFKSLRRNPFFREITLYLKGNRLVGLFTVQSDGTESFYEITSFKENIPLKDELFKVKGLKGENSP